MWTLNPLPEFPKRADRFRKKWEHEISNVLTNLKTLVTALNLGTHPEQLKQLGFVHSEPMGILAVDQKGKGKGAKLKPFRLYVFPDERTKILHLLTLGDKDTQSADIKNCQSIVEKLLQSTVAPTSEIARDGAGPTMTSSNFKEDEKHVKTDSDV